MSDVNEQNMEALLEDMQDIQERTVVPATVVSVSHSEAWVSIDAKQDVPILKKELASPEPDSAEDVVKVGDVINVYVVAKGGEHGYTLSKLKADQEESWKTLEGCVEKKEPLEVTVLKAIKGGLSVSVQGLRGFIPASHVGLHYVQDLSSFEGKTFEALPIEFDASNHKFVLSRKDLLTQEREEALERVFSTLEAGQTVKGTVKRIVDYGAFVDVGGVDGLAHISDLAWDRVKHPSDVLKVGQEIDVFVKNVDQEQHRISLSVKDTLPDPWFERAGRYEEGQIIEGKVIKLTDFGAFMEIEPGFDGLIPMGELSDKRIARADEAVHTGDIVKVKVLRIDTARKRISLSITKAAKADAEESAEE